MNSLSERSAVFVGCARNCGAQLDGVLANIEGMASLYAKAAFVFVENDSQDDTKARLLKWLANRPLGSLLQLDGLVATEPSRTARLAQARNRYLDHVRSSSYIGYDDLVVLDFDNVNTGPIDLTASPPPRISCARMSERLRYSRTRGLFISTSGPSVMTIGASPTAGRRSGAAASCRKRKRQSASCTLGRYPSARTHRQFASSRHLAVWASTGLPTCCRTDT